MRHACLLAAALTLGCGRPLLGADVEIERISVTTSPIPLPDLYLLGPLAAGLDPLLFTTTIALDYDLGGIPTDQKGITAGLWVTGFTLHLTARGPRPPDGLRAMDVTLVDPTSAATTLVASYVKGSAPTPADVAFQVSGLDLVPFLAQKKLSARLRVAFDPADLPNAFDAATELDLQGKLTVDYTKL